MDSKCSSYKFITLFCTFYYQPPLHLLHYTLMLETPLLPAISPPIVDKATNHLQIPSLILLLYISCKKTFKHIADLPRHFKNIPQLCTRFGTSARAATGIMENASTRRISLSIIREIRMGCKPGVELGQEEQSMYTSQLDSKYKPLNFIN
jgi:hypothetical protein